MEFYQSIFTLSLEFLMSSADIPAGQFTIKNVGSHMCMAYKQEYSSNPVVPANCTLSSVDAKKLLNLWTSRKADKGTLLVSSRNGDCLLVYGENEDGFALRICDARNDRQTFHYGDDKTLKYMTQNGKPNVSNNGRSFSHRSKL
jgi:hypothetical protein